MKITLTPAELRRLTFRPLTDESERTLTVQLLVDGRPVSEPWPCQPGGLIRFAMSDDLVTLNAASRLEIRIR